VKKTFIEFLVEKKKNKKDAEEKFKDLDCDCDLDTLSDEEREYCVGKKTMEYMRAANAGNN
jgi:hypothetical protein